MMGFFKNISDLAKATWDLFCTYPGYCIFMVVGVIVSILCVKRINKLAKEAKGPIILR